MIANFKVIGVSRGSYQNKDGNTIKFSKIVCSAPFEHGLGNDAQSFTVSDELWHKLDRSPSFEEPEDLFGSDVKVIFSYNNLYRKYSLESIRSI